MREKIQLIELANQWLDSAYRKAGKYSSVKADWSCSSPKIQRKFEEFKEKQNEMGNRKECEILSLVIVDRQNSAYRSLYETASGKKELTITTDEKWLENNSGEPVRREVEDAISMQTIVRDMTMKSLTIGASVGASFMADAGIMVSGTYAKESEETQSNTRSISDKTTLTVPAYHKAAYSLEVQDDHVKRSVTFQVSCTGYLPVYVHHKKFSMEPSHYEFISIIDIFKTLREQYSESTPYITIEEDKGRVLLTLIKEEQTIQRKTKVVCGKPRPLPGHEAGSSKTKAKEDDATGVQKNLHFVTHEKVDGDVTQRAVNPTYKSLPSEGHHLTLDKIHPHVEKLVEGFSDVVMEAKKDVGGNVTQEFGNAVINFAEVEVNQGNASLSSGRASAGFFVPSVKGNRKSPRKVDDDKEDSNTEKKIHQTILQ